MTTYDSILARSFSRHEQKKLGCGAFFGCFILALCICTVFKPYLGPLPVVNLQLSMGFGYKMLMITEETNQPQNLRTFTNQSFSTVQDVKIQQQSKIICNISEPRSDFCEMDGDIRIHGNSSTIFIPSISNQTNIHFIANNSWTIKPYARKGDEGAMQSVRPFKFSQEMPQYYCTQNHTVPAIVFSTGGYTGNNFHDFSDVVIPLYLTSRKFNGEVQFLIADKNIWWTTKFRKVLDKLSKYEVIDLDKENKVHCFSSMILGLKKHKELNIDPLKSPHYSMKDFRDFLRSSYGLKRETAIKLSAGKEKRRPRLLIISRKWTRAFLNQRKIVKMAKRLRFDVVLTEASSNLSQFSQVVNSCDVMMGVHGAGLTNLVFLPKNAVFIQVVPFGGLEWLATTDFGNPSKDMNLRYLEYKISEGESSLIQQYPLEHDVFKDPYSIQKKGWEAFKSVYLDKQNVDLDVGRFRATLLEALKLLRM